jgi:endo-1,4-beta-xylanase
MKEIDIIRDLINQDKEYMNDRVQRDIETNRKGYFKLNIVDKDGNPVNNSEIEIRQKSHDFNFGCNIFMLDEYDKAEKNELYKEKFKKLFNMAVVPLYWEGTEPEQGTLRYSKDSAPFYRRPPADAVVEYCLANNIRMKGHPLFWHEFVPGWLPKNKQELKPLILKRFQEISQRYADKIEMFDVVNEPSRIWDCAMRDRTKSSSLVLDDDYCDWCFQLADDLFKTNQLFLNEAVGASFCDYRGKYSGYYLHIKDMLSRGVRIDAIGMQCHTWFGRGFENVFNPKRLYNVLDTYGSFQKPIHISEISIPSAWGDELHEDLQAEVIEVLYKVAFSHKNVEGLVWWNLPDDGILTQIRTTENLPSTGLLDGNYKEKEAYWVLDDLINNQWRTELKLLCQEKSYVSFRAFYGMYDIYVNGRLNRQIHLSKDGLDEFIIETYAL